MTKLDDFRQKYPQYDNKSDSELADALYTKYYSSMPREEFNTKIGLTAPTEQRSAVGDFLKSIPRGLMTGFAAAASAGGTAAAGEMSQPELAAEIPTPEQGVQIMEKQITGELPKPQGAPGRFGAAIGETLGSPASYLGAGSLALKVGAGAVSALTSEAAGEAFGGTKLEAPARIFGSLVGGTATATAATERNLAKLAAQLPSRETVKKAAGQIYDALKTSNVRISAAGMQDMTSKIKTELIQSGARNYPNARGAVTLRLVDELPTSGGSIQGIDSVRRALRGYKTSLEEQLHADRAVDALDDYLMHVDPRFVASGNPAEDAQALHYAQGLWATHKQLKIIEEGSIKGQRRAGATGTGANRINTARQEINRILNSEKKSRGLSADVKDKMNEIVLGTWLSNRARDVGVYAPKGVVSAGPTIVAGFAGGAPAASAVAGTGFIAKYLGEYLTQRQIRELEQLIKSESPIGKPVAQAIAPQIAEQKTVPAAAAVRSVLTSPLSPESGP